MTDAQRTVKPFGTPYHGLGMVVSAIDALTTFLLGREGDFSEMGSAPAGDFILKRQAAERADEACLAPWPEESMGDIPPKMKSDRRLRRGSGRLTFGEWSEFASGPHAARAGRAAAADCRGVIVLAAEQVIANDDNYFQPIAIFGEVPESLLGLLQGSERRV